MNLHRNTTVFATLLSVLCLTASARADGIKILKNERNLDGAKSPSTVLNNSNLLSDAFRDHLSANKAALEKEIKNRLGPGDLIARGITLYAMNPRIGAGEFRFTGPTTFEFMIRNNYFYFRTTQPTDLGKWADPAFETHFDLRVRGTLSLPTASNPKIQVTSAVVDVPHIKIKSRNVAGAVVVAATNVVNYFAKRVTGKDHLARAAEKYLKFDVTRIVNSKLNGVNATLGNLYKAGHKEIRSALSGRNLEITMTKFTNASNKVGSLLTQNQVKNLNVSAVQAAQSASANAVVQKNQGKFVGPK